MPNTLVNDSMWLTHENIMDAIRTDDPARAVFTLLRYADECDLVGAGSLASQLRDFAEIRREGIAERSPSATAELREPATSPSLSPSEGDHEGSDSLDTSLPTAVQAEDASPFRHLSRCDSSPHGAPCVCLMAPHELRFLGDNVTLTRSQWETLREQMHDDAPDAGRIDEMLSEPRHRVMSPYSAPWRRSPIMPDASHTIVPDVLYYVSAAVMRRRQLDGSSEHWRVQLPGFYLDSRVQGITGEDHACRIVRAMLEDLGHASEDVTVYACATLVPVHDRSGTFTYALDLDRGEYVVYRDGAEVGAHGWETDARRQCDDRRVS